MEHAFIFITQVCWNVFLYFLLSRSSWQQGTNNQAKQARLICGSLIQPFPSLPTHCCPEVFSAVTGLCRTFQVALVVKNLPAHAGDIRDVGSIPRLGRSPGGGHGNPLQYSFLENPMDWGAWWAAVHEVTKSQTWRKRQQSHIGLCHFPTLEPFKGPYHLQNKV